MLSYRHAFHAGNHADILKHFILFLTLEYFNRKDKPYWYIDTHSGAGLYDLNSGHAQKVGEHRHGIGRLLAAAERSTLPEPLARFAGRLKTILPQPGLYCGSPWLAQAQTRGCDKLRLFELHPADFALLENNMREAGLKRRGILSREDGFKGLISLLPPPTRRAVILIDPPYEEKQDYARVAQTLKDAQKRFAQGCCLIWYPCLSREESRALPEQLKKLAPENHLCAELHTGTPRADGFGMHGSGIFAANPPYLLAEQLAQSLPALTEILAQDGGARFVLEHQAS
ncbi:Protein involved in catabolism of external DNA [Kingella potus]|uniref:Ribosomal RNA large subunit methyltransferase J n=1 Tax=Kingella potus TaxID=265175 RepID=A0A377R173_9NEIS|nr:23S rRNA (adenine(2030)-N(6))-methyltransferase RlmJ [Kingella potus]UOP00290.1 23S rRNA (adenine(2030)-N(6))-methyltransferase RlmJ [Kingella potus]STR02648.1 Protein involved in catabolism of external DNA [Kingella potus]